VGEGVCEHAGHAEVASGLHFGTLGTAA